MKERKIPFDRREGIEVWPDSARMAVISTVPIEMVRWDVREPKPAHGVSPAAVEMMDEAASLPLLNIKTSIEYGYDVGIHRIMDVIEDHGVQTTFIASGLAFQQYPDLMRALVAEDHDICAHAMSQGTPLPLLDRAGQEDVIKECMDLIIETVGERPPGWINPGAYCNQDTIELLAEHDFLYHADLKGDELPYFIDVGDKTVVEIPSRMIGGVNDIWLFASSSVKYSVGDAVDIVTSTFDAYYREAAKRPLMFRYPAHHYVSGRPEAAYVYSELLDHILSHDDVWVASYREIAEWWDEQYRDGYDLS